jgi:NMD protein affecting ribosome stability and mRNA decay
MAGTRKEEPMGEIADAMVEGLQCSHCGICFEEGHGFPVLCQDCYKHETPRERAGIPQATNKEL